MTDKEKIREEIEKKLDVMRYQVHRLDAYKELKSILDYIDSLQEEPVSEDLEKAAKDYSWAINKQVEIIKKEITTDAEITEIDIKNAYIAGYHQAEKDNELTWEDIPKIFSISEQLKTSWWFRDNEQTKLIGTQVFWEEVLKRFNKERKEL